MTSNYAPTATDMVRQIQSIIQSYGDNGPIRALAQEPVQNSLDAKHDIPTVRVEYRLYRRESRDGETYHLLTVTDSGTYGLRGSALSQTELSERDYELEGDENWAAFEGQGFTRKSNDSARGSRGQGKSAFLYHSLPPAAPGRRRMMMLYDTRLADGLYRLGVRNANPVDTIQSPPWLNGEAEQIIRGKFTDDTGIDLDLGLEPLVKVGTRVIVPYLSEEAVAAIQDGELVQWLQRCWWRAIQIGELEIIVSNEITGTKEPISVPSWWQDEPWLDPQTGGVDVRNLENIDLDGGLRIKRIVLLYDEHLQSTDAIGDDAQFDGVQLLREQQWITTIGSRQHFGGVVPRDKRPGFRGFVEFDKSLEKELKELETPQHHKFNRRDGLVQAIYREVEDAVDNFAAELGWRQERERGRRPEQLPDITQKILQWFAPNAVGKGRQPVWDVYLGFSLPDQKMARVDWGQYLKNVAVRVTAPSTYPTDVTVSLDARHAEGATEVSLIEERTVSFYKRDSEVNFGAFQVVRDANKLDQLELPVEGKWSITARVRQNSRVVGRSTRSIYVHQDPQEPPANPLSLSISPVNRTQPNERHIGRINYGDPVAVQITAKNNTPDFVSTTLDASLAGATPMLANGESRSLRGTPEGDTSDRQAAWSGDIIFCDPENMPLPTEDEVYIAVEPGRRAINADLRPVDGSMSPAFASYTLYIETDPPNPNGLPFALQQMEGELPRWQLKEVEGVLELQFPSTYSTHRELSVLDTDNSNRGRSAFLLEITCEALMQWALEPAWNDSDTTRLDELLADEPPGVDSAKWERFVDMMKQLERNGRGYPEVPLTSLAQGYRVCAAHMMRMYEESH